MLKLVVVAALAAVAVAVGRPYGYGRPAHYGPGPVRAYSAPAPHYGGYSGGYARDDYAVPTPYQTGYDIVGDYGEFKQNRQESGDGHGNVQGSYGYTDAHGIYRQVDYVADAHGFRAAVKTNEPGTDNQSPADVDLHVQQPHHYGGGGGGGHYGGYGRY